MLAIEALALVSGIFNLELLVRNEYLAAEIRILKSKVKKPFHLRNPNGEISCRYRMGGCFEILFL